MGEGAGDPGSQHPQPVLLRGTCVLHPSRDVCTGVPTCQGHTLGTSHSRGCMPLALCSVHRHP